MYGCSGMRCLGAADYAPQFLNALGEKNFLEQFMKNSILRKHFFKYFFFKTFFFKNYFFQKTIFS